jgi:hypothetical protein
MHAVWIDADGRGAPPADPPRPHASARSLAELARRLIGGRVPPGLSLDAPE